MVNLKQKEMSVSSGESSLSISNLRVVLKDLFPSQAAAAMSFHLDGLRVKGPKRTLRDHVPSFEITALRCGRERGLWRGRRTLEGRSTLGVVSVPGTLEIDRRNPLRGGLSAWCSDVEVKEFKGFTFSSVRNGRSVHGDFFNRHDDVHILRKGIDYEADIKGLRSEISMARC
jgi:hypothetical protein